MDSSSVEVIANPVPSYLISSIFYLCGSVIAVIGAYIIQNARLKREFEKKDKEKERELYAKFVSPLVEAADDFVGRFYDIIKRSKTLDYTDANIIKPESSERTTIYRFVNILATMSYYSQNSDKFANIKYIDGVAHYTEAKLKRAMKGNISRYVGIGTELQEKIGAKALEISKNSGQKCPNYYLFDKLIYEEVKSDLPAIVAFLKGDWTDGNYGDNATVALVLVYLIDIVQDVSGRCKWEEFRLFLVTILKTLNASRQDKKIFLYKGKDLESPNYLDTYNKLPTEELPGRDKRIAKRQDPHKKVTSDGVSIILDKNKTTISLLYNEAPGNILVKIRSL